MNYNGVTVSVIIPIYNARNYLKRCLDSVVSQSYPNLEIILIDDGSTDKSDNICQDYKNIDNRIKVISKKNSGKDDARRIGVKVATGCFVCFIDSDDFIEYCMIEKMLEVAINNKTDIVAVANNLIYLERPINIKHKQKDTTLYFDTFKGLENLNYSKYFKTSIAGKLIRKQLFENLALNKSKYQGLSLITSLFLNCKKSAYISYAGYNCVVKECSLLKTVNPRRAVNPIKSSLTTLRVLTDIDERYKTSAIVKVVNACIEQLIISKQTNEVVKQELAWKLIKAYRFKHIFLSHARFKNKMRLLTSYISKNLLIKVFTTPKEK